MSERAKQLVRKILEAEAGFKGPQDAQQLVSSVEAYLQEVGVVERLAGFAMGSVLAAILTAFLMAVRS